MSTVLPPIEKLLGRENFDSWKFAVQTYLELEELWDCVVGTDKDKQKDTKARSKIILLIDPINYVHVQSQKTAKGVWEALNKAFEDTGLTRRVGLLRTLITTRLEDSKSVEDYVNKIVSTAHKLSGVGLSVSDEWVGTILLAGLPIEYEPMIMGIESSGVSVTGDSIKTKLLQDIKSNKGETAMFSKKFPNRNRNCNGTSDGYNSVNRNKTVRCFQCNKYGHFAKNCDKPKKIKDKDKDKNSVALYSALSVAPNCDYNKSDWYLDSAATIHMTNNLDLLENVKNTTECSITTANDQIMCANKVGSITLPLSDSLNANIENILYVPDLKVNLLSVSQIVKKNYSVVFKTTGCEIYDSQQNVIATGIFDKDLFKLDLKNQLVACHASVNSMLWHRRLGHISFGSLNKLKNGMASGLNFPNADTNGKCEICVMGKCQRLPFKDSETCTTEVLQLVHSDLCGPIEVKSIAGSRYMLTFLDDYTHKVFVYFLKAKDEVFSCFKTFKNLVENQTGKTIKTLRTDNGGEYLSTVFEQFLKDSGIVHQLTVPRTAEQNGKAERLNRTIVEKVRCMLIDCKLPNSFWAEAAHTAVYLLNQSPTKCLEGKTPEEAWSNKKPNLEGLRIFGCKVHAHIAKEIRKKLDRKTIASIMVGYSTESKAYRLYNPSTGKVFVARDVVFFEEERGSLLLEQVQKKQDKQFFVFPDESALSEDQGIGPEVNDFDQGDLASENNENESIFSSLPSDSEEQQENDSEYHSDPDFVPDQVAQVPADTTRRSERDRKLPKSLDDYEVSYATMVDFSDPQTIEEALSRPDSDKWRAAMKEEYSALIENKTWDLVDYTGDEKPLKCKWVFKTKKNAHGTVVKHKARLVIKGCSQKKGIDYEETYSPVVRYTSIRYLLALAAEFDLDIDQLDAVTAFLQGDLTEKIFMIQPEGFSQSNKLCRLKKSLYGLKQASRVWNLKLDECLKTKCDLSQSKTDPCIYYKFTDSIIIILAVYVDDMIILSNDKEAKVSLKNQLMSQFKMKDIGEARFVLGMQITRDRKNKKIWLDQELYIENIIKKYNMWDCNPIDTPVLLGEKLSKDMSPKTEADIEKMANVPYQEVVGSLLFAAQVSRPDISYAVNNVSRFTQNPGPLHWTAVKRIIRYLKGTLKYRLKFDCSENKTSEIVGYADADWASNPDDRRSVTGYVFLKNGTAISWATKRQATVALSTTESEYMAMSMAAQEALWLRRLSEEFQQCTNATVIHVDNQGAQHLAQNGSYHARTKHIDVRHHFLKEKIAEKLLDLKYVSTDRQVADSLTKAVEKKKHLSCARSQGLSYFK